MIFTISKDSNLYPHIIAVLFPVGIFTHGLRKLEYFYDLDNRFLSNVPLLVLNT